MKKGWVKSHFGDVCHYRKNNGTHKDLRYIGLEHIEQGNGQLLGTLDSNSVLSTSFRFQKGDVLYGRLRPYLKKAYVAEFDGCCSTEIFPIHSECINPSFLKYWFLSDKTTQAINETCSGCRMPRGNMNEVLKFDFCYPPLSEQQEIVEYLDSSFAKIDAMKANAAKNLEEAKSLFQSALKEALEPKEGWEEKFLVKEFSLNSGDNLPAKKQIDGQYPVYGGNGIAGYHNEFNISGDNIFIGRVGALCGNIHHVHGEVWVTDNAFVVNSIAPCWNTNFLAWELKYLRLNQYASQTAQPVVSNKSMKDVKIFLPPLSEQQTIVTTLDSLKSKVDQLQANYDQIAKECDALKQAILRQVFE